ncbi:MAG: FAD-binding oxidoreductase [Actinomycetota bacterium]|nr:FAD-binding oxidoreductase [Actinomycetota bacterium]
MRSDVRAEYEARRARLLEQYAAVPADAPVRLGKTTSNLFRARRRSPAARLDVSGFDGMLGIDPVMRTADVQGMTTYEQLVAATLRHGLMPLVVPQLKTITLGGAVTGLGIESSSFRNGMPHESVLEMEILTGDGRVVTARPDNEHAALFYGFPNSYGTLGYVLRLSIELEPVQPFVRLRHVRFTERHAYFTAMAQVCQERSYDGDRVDFVDGTVFGQDELYLTLATFVEGAPTTSDYTGMAIYYRSLQHRSVDHLTVHDYLWRWDTDWFWCSRVFGVQDARIRRLVPKRWLRSDNYWRLVDLEKRYGLRRRLDRLRGRPREEHVVQDIEVPVERAPDFFDFLIREIPISPFWVCPLRQRDPTARWDLYALDPATLYVNFGFWSTVPLADGQSDGTHNRRIERVVGDLGGRKSLYSTSYYGRDEFWRLYNGPVYGALKRTYDGEGRLLELYDKCVERR